MSVPPQLAVTPDHLGAFLVALALLLVAAVVAGLVAQHRRHASVRAAERALRASEERLRFALEATTEVVWDLDVPTGKLFQPRWASTFGYPEERNPRTFEELGAFVHPDDAPAVARTAQDAIGGKTDVIEIEHRLRHASGEYRWCMGKGRVVARGPDGVALRVVGTCTDITESKRMLAQLQHADRMASVGTLAAGVAHEINNPLAYVVANVGFAADAISAALEVAVPGRTVTPGLARSLEECGASLLEAGDGAERVRTIVRDLKLFSRVEEKPCAPVAVDGVLAAALHLAENEMRHRARVDTRFAPVPPVLADESRLSQVFVNLLVNAAQAIPEGRAAENRIEVEVRPDGAGRVAVEVRDTGCGIPPENLGRVFEPFFTTKPVGVGTGLGLSICHGIVTSLGGRIEVESEPGKGSTFRVLLPACAGADAAVEPPAPAPSPRARGRILVVDDEPLFCRAVERVLRDAHDVTCTCDSREALRLVEAGERFDVVLADLMMPGMSGIELFEAIRKLAPGMANGMLFATGGAFTEAAQEFACRHAARVLEKPLAADAIRAAVAGALERAAAG